MVKVLRRRPVNVNTAPRRVLRALFLNVQLRGRNDRITAREAEALADLCVESRPFEGLEIDSDLDTMASMQLNWVKSLADFPNRDNGIPIQSNG